MVTSSMPARKPHTPIVVQRVYAAKRTQCEVSTSTDPRNAYRTIPVTNDTSDHARKTAGREGMILTSYEI